MAKDPAFLFYSQDFHTGTATMSFEDRGKYITILCVMHQQGRMKEETICFLVGSVSDMLRLKFKVDENGFWYNERLESEARKRSEFTESRRINGLHGGRPKKSKASAEPSAKPLGYPMVTHMENENDNEIVIEIIKWSEQILKGEDQYWEQMRGRTVTKSEMDEFLSVAVRNGWKLETQNAFRIALNGFSSNGKQLKNNPNPYKIQ